MTRDQSWFEGLVATIMDAIPEPFASALDDVAVVVARASPRDQGGAHRVYGEYSGFPLTRGGPPSGALPPRITIYMEPLLEDFPIADVLHEQVRITLLHELGHHLGMDEAQLEELGYG